MALQSHYSHLSQSFLSEVENVCRRNGWDPLALMAVMDFETGGTFSPSVRNPGSSATGLIQFMDATARELGTTTAALARMSHVQQLAYVERYLQKRQRERGPLRGLGDLYMAVFWPAAVGKPDSTVLFRKGSATYSANRGLDTNGDGVITRGEAVARVAGRLKGGGSGSVSPPILTAAMGAGSSIALLFLACIVGATGYLITTRYAR
jgi:hypothetical protein